VASNLLQAAGFLLQFELLQTSLPQLSRAE
jgi:hypothetical protein